MHASPIQAGRASSGSHLYCTTQMQDWRVHKSEKGAHGRKKRGEQSYYARSM
jgi:hypothetical protein